MHDVNDQIAKVVKEVAATESLDISVEASTEPSAPKKERKVDALGRARATGRRKESAASVWFKIRSEASKSGSTFVVNNKDINEYFPREAHNQDIRRPLDLCLDEGVQYDIVVNVRGGGMTGQCGAVRHGLSRALVHFDPELHIALKRKGFLTRDSRAVERKKFGYMKARKKTQFRKR